ncbi:MAG: hypothetical protein KDC80_17665, partial [Saprospiraceae bacterium]|nr:hypothetical protein [Saprospiraceae bacterium]
MVREEALIKLARIQIVVILVFIILKLIRPFVLEEVSIDFVRIIVLSFPNLAEGIVGTLILTGILLLFFRRFMKSEKPGNTTIYLLSGFLAAVYVLLQEFKIHNLGGNNIYDPNDVLFSILGLGLGL